ncbi:hypothetical protein P4O66_002621 [Electrophorus voltai]|uniref:GON domain-containing protein n=1 Tax=Electrophorus voltai TaxID=2609070 RepID=A0AAD8YXE1_9TELE|nr:hypothetical protein P4O66_002621 [Electrophorus voltai]
MVVCQRPTGQRLSEHSCDVLDKPPDVEQCNTQPCPGSAFWHRRPWKPCSATCGVGVQTRDVYCRWKGHGRMRAEMCDGGMRPRNLQPCSLPGCPQYTWSASEWRQCNASCGDGIKHREVLCVDKAMNHVLQDLCSPLTRPVLYQPCFIAPCSQQRAVLCSAVPSVQDLKVFADQSYTQALASECLQPAPANTRPCQLPECPLPGYWKVGPWSKCSQTCGAGVMERRVECLTEKHLPSKNCLLSSRPDSHVTCRQRQCELFPTCKELQMREGIRKDGEHYLRVKSKVLQIYCAEMQTNFPKEYVTLRSGQTDNYSEVYGYRLNNPFECPYNGSRQQDCDCRTDYPAVGYTLYHRVRLDLGTMRIITTDVQFSQTLLGQPVPFATAGDCYSAARCPQGQFSINLIGTGLKVAESTKWVSHGNYVSIKVHRSEDGTRIYGRCGGFCGKCLPHPQAGLLVQVQ